MSSESPSGSLPDVTIKLLDPNDSSTWPQREHVRSRKPYVWQWIEEQRCWLPLYGRDDGWFPWTPRLWVASSDYRDAPNWHPTDGHMAELKSLTDELQERST